MSVHSQSEYEDSVLACADTRVSRSPEWTQKQMSRVAGQHCHCFQLMPIEQQLMSARTDILLVWRRSCTL
jgi:hypothetical protein